MPESISSEVAMASPKQIPPATSRPQKRTSTKRPAKTSASEKSPSRKRRKVATKRISALESLPVELIQAIYLYCLNPALPQASPRIAVKLSSEHIYLRSILAVADEYKVESHKIHARIKDRNEDRSLSKRVNILSPLLRCRWATFSLLAKAEELLHAQWGDGGPPRYVMVKEDREKRFRQFISKDDHKIGIRALFEDGSNCKRPYNRQRHLFQAAHIPARLLRGPWTPELLEKFHYLVSHRARIDFDSTDNEDALEGLKCAISTGNISVLYLFDLLSIEDLIDTDLAVWALRNARGDKGKIFYILGEWIDFQRRLWPLGPCRTDRLEREIVNLQIEGIREDDVHKMEDARLAIVNIVALWSRSDLDVGLV